MNKTNRTFHKPTRRYQQQKAAARNRRKNPAAGVSLLPEPPDPVALAFTRLLLRSVDAFAGTGLAPIFEAELGKVTEPPAAAPAPTPEAIELKLGPDGVYK